MLIFFKYEGLAELAVTVMSLKVHMELCQRMDYWDAVHLLAWSMWTEKLGKELLKVSLYKEYFTV